MTPLYAEINRWLTVPFRWGECDCMLVLADWVERQTGIDPARDLRLTYHDRSSCQRETRFLTDPLGVTTRCFEGVAGLARTGAPVAGDVAVVRVLQDGRPVTVGALCLGPDDGWAMKAEHGATTVRQVVEVLRAWRVGYAA